MLSKEQNALLTKVEGDAPMGKMIREQFWIPALKSSQVIAGGVPVRARLVGANYIIFRGTDGRLACFDERCPHRGASLVLARNEECTLRCIFHGWKFDMNGEILETPTQTVAPERFVKSVKLKHFPVQEAGGLIWVWLGSGERPPEFPAFEFTTQPGDRISIRMATVPCNWFQGVEANQDSSHVGILHKNFVGNLGNLHMMAKNSSPVYEVERRAYGYQAAALRAMADGSTYLRITEFVMPWYSFIPPIDMAHSERIVIIAVPVDDQNTNLIYVRYDNERTISHDHYHKVLESSDINAILSGPDGNWGQDRQSMEHGNFSGFHNLVLEDVAIQLSMGPIADRSEEQLCTGDKAIVFARRLMLQTLANYSKGALPSISEMEGHVFTGIRSRADMLGPGVMWRDVAALPTN